MARSISCEEEAEEKKGERKWWRKVRLNVELVGYRLV